MKAAVTVASGILLLTTLTGCGSESTATSANSCIPADQALITTLNDTLLAYEQGETVTNGTSMTVDLPGAGTMKWDVLVAAKLNKSGEAGLWAFNESAGFVIPLNQAAINSMPDAAADGGTAVNGALNSSEGKAALACIN